jgi:hypothetical protein
VTVKIMLYHRLRSILSTMKCYEAQRQDRKQPTLLLMPNLMTGDKYDKALYHSWDLLQSKSMNARYAAQYSSQLSS